MKLLLIVLASGIGFGVEAAGTISLVNSTLSRMEAYFSSTSTVPLPASERYTFGVFWGTNRDSLQLALPVATNHSSVPGILVAPTPFAIPGTEPDQTVFLQVRAWQGTGTNWPGVGWPSAQTTIKPIKLGPEAGPGTPIWQARTGMNPDRFYPLVLRVPLTPPAWIEGQVQWIVDEGNTGMARVGVMLCRTKPSFLPPLPINPSSVLVSTRDLTAQAGRDYVPTNFLITFGSDENLEWKGGEIVVTADALAEPEEQFEIELQSNTDVIPLYLLVAPPYFVTIRESRVVSVDPSDSGGTSVTFLTTPFQRFALDSSSDLLNWSVVPGAENLPGALNRIRFVDPSPPPLIGHRFYRTRILPP